MSDIRAIIKDFIDKGLVPTDSQGEGERVNALLKGTKDRRITYKQLIAKD